MLSCTLAHLPAKLGIEGKLPQDIHGGVHVTRFNNETRGAFLHDPGHLAILRPDEDRRPADAQDAVNLARHDQTFRARLLGDDVHVPLGQQVLELIQRHRRPELDVFKLQLGDKTPDPHKAFAGAHEQKLPHSVVQSVHRMQNRVEFVA
jgi:hypothetical protein